MSKIQILVDFEKKYGKVKQFTSISLYDNSYDIDEILLGRRIDNEHDHLWEMDMFKIYQAPSHVLNSIFVNKGYHENNLVDDSDLETDQKIVDFFYKNYKPTKRDKTKIFKTKTVVQYD